MPTMIKEIKKPKLNALRFLHIRWLEDEGVISFSLFDDTKKDSIPGSYISPRGGATYAFKVIHTKTKDDKEPLFRIKAGLAKCNHKDNFCKKVGRDIALERLNSKTDHLIMTFTSGYEPDMEDIYYNLFESYYGNQEKFIGNIRDIVYNRDEIELEELV